MWTSYSFRQVVFMVVMPAFALLVVVMLINDLPDAWAASHHQGIPGVFTPVLHTCTDHGRSVDCGWYGRFVADDGTMRLGSVALQGSVEPVVAGRSVRAIAAGDPPQVYPAGGGSSLSLMLGLALVTVVCLSMWFGTIILHVRRSRREYAALLAAMPEERVPRPRQRRPLRRFKGSGTRRRR